MKDWKYHCTVLGVPEEAKTKEIRVAYRRLALERHPDQHANSVQAKEDFQKLNESYRALLAGQRQRAARAAPKPASSPAQAATPVPIKPARPPAARPPALSASPRVPAPRFALLMGIAGLFLTVLLIFTPSPPEETRARRNPFYDKPLAIDRAPTSHEASPGPEPVRIAPVKARPGPGTARPVLGTALATAQRCFLQFSKTGLSYYNISDREDCQLQCNLHQREHGDNDLNCQWGSQTLHAAQDPQPATRGTFPLIIEDPATTCFLSVAVPGDIRTPQLANSNPEACSTRCFKEIQENPGAEVHCAFAGNEFKRYIPDPEQAYLRSSPQEQPANPSTSAGTCFIQGKQGNVVVDEMKVSLSQEDCTLLCNSHRQAAASGVEVNCQYASPAKKL